MLDSITSENPNPSSTTHASQPATFASHDHIVDQERQDVQGADDAEEEIPTLNLFMTVGLLVVVTVVSCPSFSHCACKTFNRFPDCRYHRRIPCLVHQRIDSR